MRTPKRAHYTPDETKNLLKRLDLSVERKSDAETAEKNLDEMKSIIFWEAIKQKSVMGKRRHYIPEHCMLEQNL